MAKQVEQVDVYMVTGFLEAGKTTFMQKFVLPDKPSKNVKFALISFEEGEEEYDKQLIENLQLDLFYFDRDNLNEDFLTKVQNTGNYRAVFVEYNGMWQFQDFIDAMPENWAVVQVFNVMNAKTIMTENANMRQLVFDKIQSSDIAIFNRVGDNTDKLALHKLVRGVTLQTTILLQNEKTMRIEKDTIEDELPFDIKAPVIEIEDKDYAYFYRELCENIEEFDGKIVSFKALAGTDKTLGNDTYIVGRHIMQCCAADIQYYGMICFSNSSMKMETNHWYKIKGKISIRYHSVYKNKGPVLSLISSEEVEPLSEETKVATFY